MKYKVLTLTQPYATLVALGQKKIETRSWETLYRGPLAIHAAKGLGPVGGKMGLWELCMQPPFVDVLMPSGYTWLDDLPRGAIVAVCRLRYCYRMPEDGVIGWKHNSDEWIITDQERAFGDYHPGRWAWLLSDVRGLKTPIPARGQLGLWEWEESTSTGVRE